MDGGQRGSRGKKKRSEKREREGGRVDLRRSAREHDENAQKQTDRQKESKITSAGKKGRGLALEE